jgi:photosystem II stability/assembly factor-like uncharacterized protein
LGDSRSLEGVRVEDVRRCDDRIIVASDQGVFESVDEGNSWKKTLDDVDVRCLAVGSDGTVFAGADSALLYRRRPPEEAFTEVQSFRELTTQPTWAFPVAPHLPNIRSIAISPSDALRVYVGVEVGGVMLSTDGGDSWQEARECMHPDVHGLAIAAGTEDHVFAVTGVGFYRTINGAMSWESRSDGLNDLYTVAVANDPRDPEIVYASASAGRPRNWRTRPEGAMARVYRSDSGGASWQSLMEEGLVAAVDALVVDHEGTVFAGTHDGHVYARGVSEGSWDTIVDGLQGINVIATL